MPVNLTQPSFAAGELDPALYGRVDLAKYHIGARTMLNWYALSKGGASNRPGTAWVGELIDSNKAGRLIPFQFSTTQSYVLEFGDLKLRFIYNGAYVTEATKAITGATQGNPCQLTINSHDYSNGDRIYVMGVVGMTQLNGRFFTVTSTGASTITIGINSTSYTAYGSGGTAARVYTVTTPYAYADLALLKYEQSADTMTLTHRSYGPRKLVRTGSAAWTLSAIVFAPAQPAPGTVNSTAPGTSYYYAVTAINDDSGEESLQSADCGSSARTSLLTWAALTGCSQYNVYQKKNGVYGFIGIAQAPGTGGTVSFTDATIDPNTSITPPQQRNPFQSGSISSVTVNAGGSSYAAPTLTVSDPSGNGSTASLTATVGAGAITSVTVNNGGRGLTNPTIIITDGSGSGASLQINWVVDGGQVITGSDSEGNPVYSDTYMAGSVTVLAGGAGYGTNSTITVSATPYGSGVILTPTVIAGAVSSVTVTAAGSGYLQTGYVAYPTATVVDSAGTGASLTAVLSVDSTVNPGTSTYHDGRQWFAATNGQPQTMWGSVSGSYNSMAVSSPTQDNDAITRTLSSRQVNEIRHMISLTQMIVLTSGSEWKISAGAADVITPAQFVARPQSYNGCANIRPIVINDVLLYVTKTAMKVRGLQYQWAADSWTGPDYSLLSAHMFESNYLVDWSYAKDPESIVWAVRDDGAVLAFTFLLEQQVFAWSRHTFTSATVENVCVVEEGTESAVYFIVKRTIGGQTKRYVERLHTRVFATIADAWFLDSALQYSGSAATTISGLWHLVGETVYALADGIVRGPFTVSASGAITLPVAAGKVTVGKIIPDADLETLDPEQPDQAGSLQGRKKKVSHITVNLKNSANQGITAGPSGGQTTTLYAMKKKDLVNPLAAAPSSNPALITDFMHQIAAPSWDWHGRVLLRVSASPLPYTVTGLDFDVTQG